MPPPAPAPELIGIDIGGTAIKLGRFDRQGNLIAELDLPTPQPQVPGAVCQAVVDAVGADRVGIRVSPFTGLPSFSTRLPFDSMSSCCR